MQKMGQNKAFLLLLGHPSAGMVTNVFFNDCMNMGTGRQENVIQGHMVMGFQKVIFYSAPGPKICIVCECFSCSVMMIWDK